MSIQHDLSKKLQAQIGDTIQREARIAAHVLDPAEIVMMLIEAAVMMACTASASAGAHAADSSGSREMFNFTMDAIIKSCGAAREAAVERMLAQMSERSAA